MELFNTCSQSYLVGQDFLLLFLYLYINLHLNRFNNRDMNQYHPSHQQIQELWDKEYWIDG